MSGVTPGSAVPRVHALAMTIQGRRRAANVRSPLSLPDTACTAKCRQNAGREATASRRTERRHAGWGTPSSIRRITFRRRQPRSRGARCIVVGWEKRDDMSASWAAVTTIASVAVVGLLTGCGSHSCTDEYVACERTGIIVQTPSNTWATGTYSLTLTLDGAVSQCTIVVPDPPSAGGMAGTCPIGASYAVSLDPVESCPPVVCSDSACEGMTCTPIPGQFQMTIAIQGLPTQVGLDLAMDGKALASKTLTPVSETTEPNGPGCGTCTNARGTVMIAG
jgi:hypothetical protein